MNNGKKSLKKLYGCVFENLKDKTKKKSQIESGHGGSGGNNNAIISINVQSNYDDLDWEKNDTNIIDSPMVIYKHTNSRTNKIKKSLVCISYHKPKKHNQHYGSKTRRPKYNSKSNKTKKNYSKNKKYYGHNDHNSSDNINIAALINRKKIKY